MLIIAILVFGMGAGWVAQLILREGSGNWGQALGAGIAGSFLGGAVSSLINGDGFSLKPSGIIGTIAGAVIVLAIYTRIKKRKA